MASDYFVVVVGKDIDFDSESDFNMCNEICKSMHELTVGSRPMSPIESTASLAPPTCNFKAVVRFDKTTMTPLNIDDKLSSSNERLNSNVFPTQSTMGGQETTQAGRAHRASRSSNANSCNVCMELWDESQGYHWMNPEDEEFYLRSNAQLAFQRAEGMFIVVDAWDYRNKNSETSEPLPADVIQSKLKQFILRYKKPVDKIKKRNMIVCILLVLPSMGYFNSTLKEEENWRQTLQDTCAMAECLHSFFVVMRDPERHPASPVLVDQSKNEAFEGGGAMEAQIRAHEKILEALNFMAKSIHFPGGKPRAKSIMFDRLDPTNKPAPKKAEKKCAC